MKLDLELDLIKNRLKRVVGENRAYASDGGEDTFITHIAGAVGELEAAIRKLEKLKNARRETGRETKE